MKANLHHLQTKKKCLIVFIGHGQLIGSMLPTGHIFETGGDFPIREDWFKDLNKDVDFVRLGDFHKRDDYYVGAALAQDWKDMNIIPGFEIIDTETHETEFIENPHSPLFIQKKIKSMDDINSLPTYRLEDREHYMITLEYNHNIPSETLEELEKRGFIIRIDEGANYQARTENPLDIGIDIHDPEQVIPFWTKANGINEEATDKLIKTYRRESK